MMLIPKLRTCLVVIVVAMGSPIATTFAQLGYTRNAG